MRDKGFIPHSYKTGGPYPWEYHTASAIGTMEEGMALTMADGKLVKATGAEKPKYIGMYRGNVADGDVIPVIQVDSGVTFETTFAASAADVNVGDKVTIHTDGLQVTATTASGVAEVIAKIDDNDEAGDRVLVRFT